MKMIMAFNVVGIHVGTAYGVDYSTIVNFILDMAVPFFFVCSGFFIQNKISKSNNVYCVLYSSCIRYIKLYVIWQIIYFPVSLKSFIANSHDFWDNLYYCVHNFLFVGEIGFSWPLWYLHGLIVSVLFVCLLYKLKLSLPQIWLVSVLMMLLGYFISIVSVSDCSSIRIVRQNIVGFLGSADRNGPFRGFALVTTGMIIHKYLLKIRYKLYYGIGIICIFISYILYCNSLPLYLILSGGGVFIIASSIRLVDLPLYFSLRFCSTMVYFMHMFFLLLANMVMINYINNASYVYLIWIIVFFVTWMVAVIMYHIRECRFFHWINHLV